MDKKEQRHGGRITESEFASLYLAVSKIKYEFKHYELSDQDREAWLMPMTEEQKSAVLKRERLDRAVWDTLAKAQESLVIEFIGGGLGSPSFVNCLEEAKSLTGKYEVEDEETGYYDKELMRCLDIADRDIDRVINNYLWPNH